MLESQANLREKPSRSWWRPACPSTSGLWTELVTRFEEADYSEHEIARRHYEAMYRAWRTVVGE